MNEPPIPIYTLSPHLPDASVLAVVDRFLDLSLQHPLISPFYRRIDRSRLRHKLAGFLCECFGGLEYDREAMAKAHKSLCLTNAHFDAVVEILQKALLLTHSDGSPVVPVELRTSVLVEAESTRTDITSPKRMTATDLGPGLLTPTSIPDSELLGAARATLTRRSSAKEEGPDRSRPRVKRSYSMMLLAGEMLAEGIRRSFSFLKKT